MSDTLRHSVIFPGLEDKDVNISLEDGTLTLCGEKKISKEKFQAGPLLLAGKLGNQPLVRAPATSLINVQRHI